MPLGPGVPQWRALADRLAGLAGAAHAANALIGDSSGALYCRAYAVDVTMALPLVKRIGRGRIRGYAEWHERDPDGTESDPRPCVARWFEGLYFVVLLFDDDDADIEAANRAIRDALPEIARLTVALPPPDGPDTTSGAAAKRIA